MGLHTNGLHESTSSSSEGDNAVAAPPKRDKLNILQHLLRCLCIEEPRPPTLLPSNNVLSRLAERYGTADISRETTGVTSSNNFESDADAEITDSRIWLLNEDVTNGDEKKITSVMNSQRSLKMNPWRLLRMVKWKTPPRRMLLVSDNLPESELIVDSTHSNVEVIHVKYNDWTLGNLMDEISKKAKGRKFTSIGLFDHGGPGEFCLLKSVAGGCIDMGAFMSDGADKDAVVRKHERIIV